MPRDWKSDSGGSSPVKYSGGGGGDARSRVTEAVKNIVDYRSKYPEYYYGAPKSYEEEIIDGGGGVYYIAGEEDGGDGGGGEEQVKQKEKPATAPRWGFAGTGAGMIAMPWSDIFTGARDFWGNLVSRYPATPTPSTTVTPEQVQTPSPLMQTATPTPMMTQTPTPEAMRAQTAMYSQTMTPQPTKAQTPQPFTAQTPTPQRVQTPTPEPTTDWNEINKRRYTVQEPAKATKELGAMTAEEYYKWLTGGDFIDLTTPTKPLKTPTTPVTYNPYRYRYLPKYYSYGRRGGGGGYSYTPNQPVIPATIDKLINWRI